MLLPDGRPLEFDDDVLADPSSAENRVVLWLRGKIIGGYQHWERVGTVARAEFTADRGIRAVAASSIPARQWVGSPIGRLFRRFRGPRAERSWPLPGGGTAEQSGPRQADLMLVWAEDEAAVIDEAKIRGRWQDCQWSRPVGRNLHLVSIPAPERPALESAAEPAGGPGSEISARRLAERALGSARRAGDGRGELAASHDLAVAILKEGDSCRAKQLLLEALEVVRRIGSKDAEVGILIDLGLASLELGRPDEARDILGQSLELAREVGDRHAEKLALDRLGHVSRFMGHHTDALIQYDRALALADSLGDGPHGADLLWQIAVEHADLGDRDRAGNCARAAVDRMRQLGRPQAEWFARHLAEFREDGQTPLANMQAGPGASYFNSSIDASAVAPASSATGAGPLRMALTAAAAMAKFVGSGFRASDRETIRSRLEVCSTCEHHTGLRCRVCGCFTAAKARMHHERCPIGRW